jgi:hypothetical protein
MPRLPPATTATLFENSPTMLPSFFNYCNRITYPVRSTTKNQNPVTASRVFMSAVCP